MKAVENLNVMFHLHKTFVKYENIENYHKGSVIKMDIIYIISCGRLRILYSVGQQENEQYYYRHNKNIYKIENA